MSRLLAAALICMTCVALQLPGLCQSPDKKARAKVSGISSIREKNAMILSLLNRPVETKQIEERVKLKAALETLSQQFGGKLPFVVNKEAFREQLGDDAPDPYEEEVSLPAVRAKMTANMAMRFILSQIGKGNGAFMIRQGYVEITTPKHNTSSYLLYQPAIVASFDNRPLAEILHELSDETGLEIHIDPNLAKKANIPITATFRNSSLENALVVVTEMTELKYVVFERSIYVTTPPNAKILQQEEKNRAVVREAVRQTMALPARP